MQIGVPREIHEGERRVAVTPDAVAPLQALGYRVAVEAGAGAEASFDDEAYRRAGATVVPSAGELWASSDIILKVRGPEPVAGAGGHELDRLRRGQTPWTAFRGSRGHRRWMP
jgi:NAD(P) transhydrogenase subunit alpha